MYCKKCGAQVPDSAKFCQVCGGPIGQRISQQGNFRVAENQSEYMDVNRPKRKRLLMIVTALAAIFVVVITGLTLFVLLNRDHSGAQEMSSEILVDEMDTVASSSIPSAGISKIKPSPTPVVSPIPSKNSPQVSARPSVEIPDENVRYLQKLLIRMGEDDVTESGLYDEKTQKAVKKYQKALGLDTTKDADWAFWVALKQELQSQRGLSACTLQNKATAELYPSPKSIVTYDEDIPYEGEEVKYIQAALVEMNYEGIAINGIYDAATEAAVKRFQKNHSYKQTGTVDAAMVGNLYAALTAWRNRPKETPTPKPSATLKPTVEPTPAPVPVPTIEPTSTPEPSLPPVAVENYLVVDDVWASSVLTDDTVYTYEVENLFDNNLDTAWVEGVSGNGEEEYIGFSISAGTKITGGIIMAGYCKTESLFFKNAAPTMIEISSGNQTCIVDLSEAANDYKISSGGYQFTLDEPLISDGTVYVTIKEIRSGSTYEDTSITELWFAGAMQ